MLGIGRDLGSAVGPEPDLDDLPVALVLAEAEQVLGVVVAPEPVLQPQAVAVRLGARVHALAVGGIGLEPARGGHVVADLVEPVALADVVGGQQGERQARSRACDDAAAAALECVAAVVGDRGRRHRAVRLLRVVHERGLVLLEARVERAHTPASVSAAVRR